MPVQRLSNAAEDFAQGALYPGGSGIFTDFKFAFWDYNGTQPPDSNIAVQAIFQPTDGSNENQPLPIYWNVGPAAEYAILDNGAFLGSEHKKGISDACNWKQALDAFKKAGGLDDKLLNGPNGMLVMRGTEATITRVDQKERENFKDEPAEKEGKDGKKYANKRTILVPTRCKFPWEKGGARPVAVMPTPGASATANATASAPASGAPAPGAPATANPAPGTAPGPVAVNGTGGTFADVVDSILTAQGGTVEMANLPKLIVEASISIDRASRIQYTKMARDEAEMNKLAAERSWTYGGGMLIK